MCLLQVFGGVPGALGGSRWAVRVAGLAPRMRLAFREEEKFRVARPELLAARAEDFRAQLGFYRRARHVPRPPTTLSLRRSALGLRLGAPFTRPV